MEALVRVRIDPTRFLRAIRDGQAAEETIRMKHGDESFIEVRYEDLAATNGSSAPGTPLRQLGDFLGAGAFEAPKKTLPVKQGAWRHEEVVENWAELQAAILGSEFAPLLETSS
jgi:hypothetical protein